MLSRILARGRSKQISTRYIVISRTGTRRPIDSCFLFKRNASSLSNSTSTPHQAASKITRALPAPPVPPLPLPNIATQTRQTKKMLAQKSKAPEEPIPLPTRLPALPVPVAQFVKYVEQNPGVPVRQLMGPFIEYESVLRAYFAQQPDHEFVQGHANLISLFEDGNADLLKIRARNLVEESKEESEKYIMSLDDDERKASGERILVQSLEEFRNNFNLFSEGSLINLDWSNIIAAGSSVLTPLLKVPEKYAENKRTLREYYHEKLAPASDIDLFIYGIEDPQEAIKKMYVIEETIKNNLLWETTTIRTRNTVTIVSQYPNRHIQIVLRLYKSASQILTGFDVPCSCFAYDGKRVLSNPRALASCMTQCNDIDLTRRSPSYENRLSKYSHRGFEVYCDFLDRSRIDPSIFERSFGRTVGLARLLVLEALPKPEDRDNYVEQRRREMGRPQRNTTNRWVRDTRDIKARVTDEVAEWDFEDVSGYQKFSIPYGADYNAKRIEKLFFKKDLLLNAEWNPMNQPPNRTVGLHRHPVFFGNVKDVVVDCCGFCPAPLNEEEKKVFEEEDKVYVSGSITFLSDDPGRQEIGSFYPLGAEDYTDMAYVGSTEQLCEAIVDNDVAYVKSWCAQEGVDLNRRDFCGRTPLLLGCLSKSTELEIVETLVNAGARLVARLQDGRTALHLAAARGRADMVKVLLEKSSANEHERDEKEEKKKAAEKTAGGKKKAEGKEREDEEMKDRDENGSEDGSDGSYDNMSDASSERAGTTTTRGFVKVDSQISQEESILDPVDEEDDDIYDINIIDWDNGMSPLHHAIVGGHEDVVEALVSGFGADVLLPMKIYGNNYNGKHPTDAILNIVLALKLKDMEKKANMAETLLKVGASSAQANSFFNTSALHYVVMEGCMEVLDKMFELDGPSAMSVINKIGNAQNSSWTTNATPLITAITRSKELVNYILDRGARSTITLEDYIHSLPFINTHKHTAKDQSRSHSQNCMQPIEAALTYQLDLDIISRLITLGADPSTITQATWGSVGYTGELPTTGSTVLDMVRQKIDDCKRFLKDKEKEEKKENKEFKERVVFGSEVLNEFEEGSYQRFCAERQRDMTNRARMKHNKKRDKQDSGDEKAIIAEQRKKAAVEKLTVYLEGVEKGLVNAGAKTYFELYPEKHELVLKMAAEQRARELQYSQNTSPLFSVPVVEKIDTDHIFKVDYNFRVPYLGEGDVQKGYLRLFEAIWRGTPEDANIVKELTLGPSGEEKDRLPALRITAWDSFGFSTLWLAIYRRNWDMVKLILAIVQEQYQPRDESSTEKRYVLEAGDNSDADSDVSHDEIRMQVVDTAFTVDNIGAKRELTKCNTSPYSFLSNTIAPSVLLGRKAHKEQLKAGILRDDVGWTPLGYAIYKVDMELFRFVVALAEETKEDGARTYIDSGLRLALTLGRTEILEEIMKTVSFAIPFEELEEADEEFQMQKPKYYQGLTVYGKKRKDWASSSYPAYGTSSDKSQKPIQVAVYFGQLDSIKWLLSERPFECLKVFMESHPDTMRTKLLKKQGDKLGFLLQKGLGVETTLLPHLAVKGWSSKYPMETLRFLLSRPGALEARTNLSMNIPLYAVERAGMHKSSVAVVEELRRPEYESDFSARDIKGRNAIHHILAPNGVALTDVKRLNKLLSLLPEDILETGWTQRMLGTSQTPLAYWLNAQQYSSSIHIPTLRLILGHSKGRELGIANSEGNLPIHWLYQRGYDGAARIIVEMAPQYIHSENANGRTPIEIATSRYLLNICQSPPAPPGHGYGKISYVSALEKHLSSFYPTDDEMKRLNTTIEDRGAKTEADEDKMEVDTEMEKAPIVDVITWEWDQSDAGDMYHVALSAQEKYPGKRKLVSLADANELAKRITSGANNQPVAFDGGDILSLW